MSGLFVASEALAAGELKWQKTYPESEAPYFVRVDKSGNIYVIGRYYVEAPENAEIFVKKYLRDSTLVWSDTTSGVDLKLPIAVELDAAGNVYVLAQYVTEGATPAALYKFNTTTGQVAWSQTFLPAGNFKQSAARDLTVDAGGNSVICVNFVVDDPLHPLRSDSRSFLIRYNTNGSQLWMREDALGDPSVSFERVKSAAGTIFVIGTALSATDTYDGFVAGYSTAGDSLWTLFSGLDPVQGVFPQGNAVDSSGNFLAIFSDNDSTIYKKVGGNGSVLFDKKAARAGFGFKGPVCSDKSGNFYSIITDDLGNQILQRRNSSGDVTLSQVIGSVPSPYPVVYAGNNTILSWNGANQPTQYSLNGVQLWHATEAYSSLGDFASSAIGETYWVLYLYDDVIQDLLYRKLVKYDLGSLCGDVNASGRIDITDAVYIVNYIFASGPAPRDRRKGDVNCSNRVDISDVVYIINFIFASGPAPCNNCL
jgi:hypothetical protein